MLAPQTTESIKPPRLNGSLTTPATAEMAAICKAAPQSRPRKYSGPASMNTMTTKHASDTRTAAIVVDALVAGIVMRADTQRVSSPMAAPRWLLNCRAAWRGRHSVQRLVLHPRRAANNKAPCRRSNPSCNRISQLHRFQGLLHQGAKASMWNLERPCRS